MSLVTPRRAAPPGRQSNPLQLAAAKPCLSGIRTRGPGSRIMVQFQVKDRVCFRRGCTGIAPCQRGEGVAFEKAVVERRLLRLESLPPSLWVCTPARSWRRPGIVQSERVLRQIRPGPWCVPDSQSLDPTTRRQRWDEEIYMRPVPTRQSERIMNERYGEIRRMIEL